MSETDKDNYTSFVANDNMFVNNLRESLPVMVSHVRCGMHTLQELISVISKIVFTFMAVKVKYADGISKKKG